MTLCLSSAAQRERQPEAGERAEAVDEDEFEQWEEDRDDRRGEAAERVQSRKAQPPHRSTTAVTPDGPGRTGRPDRKKAVDPALVAAIDRDPKPGTPIIANKKFPMALTLEMSAAFDYSFSDRFVNHAGGHVSLGFHIFDWLGIEAFAGGFYPQELNITRSVREKGISVLAFGQEPALSGLWQTFAFGGAGLLWTPFYGKISLASDYQFVFQAFLFGGAAVEGIAKPVGVDAGGAPGGRRDLFVGLLARQPYNLAPRFSAYTGGGVRIIPWRWFAVRFELRNLTGLNPPVDNPQWRNVLDVNNMPLVQVGLSILL